MWVRANLCGVQGVGEDGADRPLSRRQTGVLSGMFVFLCHLGWTWEQDGVRCQSGDTRNVSTQEPVRREQIAAKVLHYYPQIQAIRRGQSLFLPSQALLTFFQPHWLRNMINGLPLPLFATSHTQTHARFRQNGQPQNGQHGVKRV